MSNEPSDLVLVVEDDPKMRKFLRVLLVNHDFRVVEAESGEDAIAKAATETPDLVLLDLGLPDMDGIKVTQRLREWTITPIVVISGRESEKDKVKALDAGADDYVTKPFGPAELLARLRVCQRHIERLEASKDEPEIEIGGLRIDLSGRQVFVDEEAIHLTPIEYKVLATLAQHCGKVLTHRQILKEVWGPPYEDQSHYVRVYMAQLRRKLESDPSSPEYIVTETGVGYRLRSDMA